MGGDLQLRRASTDDREALLNMQALSMRILATPFYGDRAVEAFVAMGTMDDALLEEGRYYLAEVDGQLVGSGGWSTQMPGYAAILEAKPANDSDIKARVRSVYVHPLFVRQGIARLPAPGIAAAGERELGRHQHGQAPWRRERATRPHPDIASNTGCLTTRELLLRQPKAEPDQEEL